MSNTHGCFDCDAPASAVQQSWQNQEFGYGAEPDTVALQAFVPVWTCTACGSAYTNGEAESIRHDAVCAHLGRVSPDSIKGLRLALGLSQADFADTLGFSEEDVFMWEGGGRIQGRVADARIRKQAQAFAELHQQGGCIMRYTNRGAA